MSTVWPSMCAGLGIMLAAMSAAAVGEERFHGGAGDGYDEGVLIQSGEQNTGARFAGGAGDGEDASGVANWPNPLLGDSDGDLLADWWERVYATDLATLRGDLDTDSDGASDAHEYAADTVPMDPTSSFRIESIVPAEDSVGVTFSCTNSRYYSLQKTASLGAGVWDDVAEQTRVQGHGDGRMSLDDTNTPSAASYRVLVSRP